MRLKTRFITLTALGLLVLVAFSGVLPAAHAQSSPSVAVSLSDASVEQGTAITATMSFSGLASDSDTSTTDYIFRADVVDADQCENRDGGYGLGVDRYMYRVDDDPEVRTGTISADCPVGDYTIRATISTPQGVELASATASFTVAAPAQEPTASPTASIALSPSNAVEQGTEITAAMSFGGLASDSDTSTTDYVFRADVVDADDCEGGGMGKDRYMYRVDDDPEVRTGTVSADCPAGAYTLRVSISSADNTELASASAGFFILRAPQSVEPPTLTALSVSHGDPAVEVELSPAFESGTLEYRADVKAAQVTVAPTASDSDATVAYLDGNGDAIADADAGADGHQVGLDAGSNTVKVAVSKGGLTTTYTVKLFRLVTQQQNSDVTLVSNTGQAAGIAFGVGNNDWAQSFTTGSNSGGYNLSSIELDFNSVRSELTSSNFTVSIWSATAADPPLPDSLLHTLDSPSAFTTGTVAFSASSVTLMPGTYFVHVSSAYLVRLNRTQSLAEDSDPAQGWSIGDLRYYRGRGSTSSPWQNSTILFKFAVKGSAASGTQPPQSSDATLSGLTLSEGRLAPAFGGGTTDYTASVGYTVSRITVTPTTTDGGATVAFLDSGDAALADADGSANGHQVDLAVGENVVKVKVTAADSIATETYTVTVTRTAEDTLLNPPLSDPAAAVRSSAVYSATFRAAWSTAVTPDGVPTGAHFTQLVGGVHNAAVAFLSGGGTATGGVESVAEDGVPTSFKNEIDAAGANSLSVLESETGGSNDYGATGTFAVDNFTLSTDHPRVTLITMIAPSPDWFVGVAGLSLLDADGNWVQSLTVNLYPWDAGTEDGTGFAMVNAATSPQGTITSIRGTGEFSTDPIATLTFARQSVNAAPVFPATETGARSVAENSLAGTNVGDPVAATDTDTLVYSLGGDDSSLFGLNSGTGQISVAAGTDLDYETKTTYSVTVTAADTAGQTAEIDVTISVSDVAEPPGKPDVPSVSAKPGSSTELDVSWSAPANTGPPIDDYNVRYRVAGETIFSAATFDGTGTSTTIEGLTADTSYSVQVLAHNDEGYGAWSDSGTGSTNAPALAGVVTLTLDPTTVAEDAGTAVTVTATLSGAHATQFTVTVTAAAVSPAADSAYTLSANRTLTFTANATESTGTVTITPVNNTVNEPKNKVITVSGTVAAGVTGVTGPADVELTITDDDHPVVTYTLTLHENDASKTPLDLTNVPENLGQVCIRVTATTEAALPPEIDDSPTVSSMEGTARTHKDYSVVSHLFPLPVSAYSLQGGKYVAVADNCAALQIMDDAVDEANEQFGLFMQGTPNTPGPYLFTNGRDNPLMVTITDDDLPTLTALSVSHGDPAVAVTLVPGFDSGRLEYDADVAYGVVQVTVAAEAAAGVEVSFVQADGSTAQADADAGADGHQVALSPGDNVIKVKATRGDESQTYTVTVTRARATVTIAADAAEADEGDALSFTVTRSPVAADELEVKLNVSETGSFVPPGNEGMKTVTIPANTASAKHTVTTDAGDDAWDAHSTVTVALVAETDSPYTLGGANSAQTQVLDDDFPRVTAVLAVDPNPVAEGGTVTVTVTVTTNSDQEPHADGGTITLGTTAGTAQAADYGALSETTFTLAQGDFSTVTVGGNTRYRATYTATVSTVDDATEEGDETFSVSMARGGDLDNRVTLGTPTSRSITISANDAASNAAPVFPSGTITRSVDENTASGQNVGSPVEATDTDTGDTLTYSLEGTDSGSFSIVNTSGQIQTSAALNYEAKSSYSVTVKVNDGTVNATKAVTINVTDVAEPPGTPAAPSVTAKGGTTESLDVSWTAPVNTERPAIDDYNVQYRIGTTGSFTSHSFNGTDRSTTITGLTAGTSYEVQVQAHNGEGDSPWSASGTGSTAAAAVSVVTLNLDATTIDEDSGTAVTVTATLSAAQATRFTVTVTAAAVFPATDAAYTLSANTTLTFAANATDSTGTVTITPEDNTLNERDKVITVSGTVVAGVTGVTGPDDVTLTIEDDDHPVVTHVVTLHRNNAARTLLDPAMIPENVGQVCVRVTATTEADLPPEQDGNLYVFTRSLTTSANFPPIDYRGVGSGFEFPLAIADYTLQSGRYVAVNEQCTLVAIVDDSLDEDNEDFQLYMRTDPSTPPPSVYVFGNLVVVTIIDNDDAPALSITDADGDEGQTLEFTVALDAASEKPVTVDWAVNDGTATAGDDYTDGSGTLTFPLYQTTKTISVATLQETVPEDDETFTVTLSNASNATIAAAEATGTIAASDGFTKSFEEPVCPAQWVTESQYEENPTGCPRLTLVDFGTVRMDWDDPPGALLYATRYYMDVDGVAKWYTSADPYPGVNNPSSPHSEATYSNLPREANIVYFSFRYVQADRSLSDWSPYSMISINDPLELEGAAPAPDDVLDETGLHANAPGKPVLSAVPSSANGGRAALSWTGSSNSPTGYQVLVEYSSGEGVNRIIITLETTTTNYTYATLREGTRRTFRMRGVNANGPGAWSDPTVFVADREDDSYPRMPKGFTAYARPNGQVEMSWHDPDAGDGVTGYRIVRVAGWDEMMDHRGFPVDGVTVVTTSRNPVATTYTESGLTANTEYRYAVQWIKAGVTAADDVYSALSFIYRVKTNP